MSYIVYKTEQWIYILHSTPKNNLEVELNLVELMYVHKIYVNIGLADERGHSNIIKQYSSNPIVVILNLKI